MHGQSFALSIQFPQTFDRCELLRSYQPSLEECTCFDNEFELHLQILKDDHRDDVELVKVPYLEFF